MIGEEGVASLILARIEDAMPAKTAELRERLDIDDPLDLPDLMEAYAHQVGFAGMGQFPFFELTDHSTPGGYTAEMRAPGQRSWIVTYKQSGWLWVRGESHAQTTAIKRRLTLALLEVLLPAPLLADGVSLLDVSVSSSGASTVDAGTQMGVRFDLTTQVEESMTFTVPLIESVVLRHVPHPTT